MSIESPFVGLSPFDEEHQRYFFGRSSDASVLAANILASKLLVAFGRSGVGKSSLFLAGVRPALDAFEETTYVCLRDWRGDPYETVKDALVALADEAERASLDDTAAADPVVALAFEIAKRRHRPLVLVLDQFEDYFQYRDEDARVKFEAALSRIVFEGEYDVHVVISLRDDAVYRLDRLKIRIPEVMRRMIEVEGLGIDSAAETIRQPIATFNAEHGTSFTVDDAFVSELIAQVRTDAVAQARATANGGARKDGVEAPFLQLALTTLWAEMQKRGAREMSLGLLQSLGGAREIASRHLKVVIESFNGRQQNYLATIFDRLITSEGHKIAMSAEELSTIVKGAVKAQALVPTQDVSADVRDVLDRLSTGSNRILRVTENGRYELFHDVLAKPVLDWIQEFEERKRTKRLHRIAIYSVTAAALALAALLVVLVENGNRRTAVARELARAAVGELDNNRNPEGAIVAAAKVVDVLRTAAERNAETSGLIRKALWSGLSRVRSSTILSVEKACRKVSDASIGPQGKWTLADLPRSHDYWVYAVEFSADGKRVITGSGDKTARIWDVETKECLCQLNGHENYIRGVAFNPVDSAMVATVSWDRTARLWNAETCTSIGRFSDDDKGFAHARQLRAVAFSADGTRLATASYDRKVGIWEVAGRKLIKKLDAGIDPDKPEAPPSGHRGDVLAVAFHPSSNSIIASGSGDRTARIWDISNPDRVTSRVLGGPDDPSRHTEEVYSVAFSPSGEELATSSLDNSVRIWDPRSGRMIRGPLMHKFDVWRAVYGATEHFSSPVLVTASWDQSVHIFNARTFEKLIELTGHTRPVRDVAISRNGMWIASAASDTTARLWDLSKVRGAERVHTHPERVVVKRVVASPSDSSLYVTAADDGVVRLWDVRQGPCPVRMLVDGFAPPGESSMPLVPEGAARGAGDGAAVSCQEPKFTKDRYNPGEVFDIAFDPAGKTIFAAYQCGRVIAWDAASGARKWVREPDFGGGSCRADSVEANWRSQALALAYLAKQKQLAVMVNDRLGSRMTRIVRIDAETKADVADGDIAPTPGNQIHKMAAAPSGDWLAISEEELGAFEKGSVRLLPIAANGSVAGERKPVPTAGVVEALAFDANSTRLAGAVRWLALVWPVSATGLVDEPVTLQGHQGDLTALLFDPSGRFLLTTSHDETVRVWDLDTRVEIVTLAPHTKTISSVAVTSDRKRIISGSNDQTSIVLPNLVEYDWAHGMACGANIRRALTRTEVDRIFSAAASVDSRSFLAPFYTILDKDELMKPIVCGR